MRPFPCSSRINLLHCTSHAREYPHRMPATCMHMNSIHMYVHACVHIRTGGTTARINNSRMSTHKKHFQGAVVSEKKETNQMRAWGCFSEKIRPGHDPILHRGGDEASQFVNNIRDKVGFGSGPRSNTAYDMQTVDNDYRYDNAQPYDEYAGERSGVRRTGRRRVGMADRYDPKDPYNTMQHRNEHLQELERNTQESYDFYSGGHSSSTSSSSDGQRLRGGEREGKEKQLHDRADRESQPITADTRTYGHRRQPSRRHRSSYAPDTPEHSRPQRRLDQEKRNRGHLQGILGSTTHHQRTNSAFNVQDLVDTDTHALSQSAEPADQLQDHGIDLSIPAIRRLPTDSNLRKPSVRFIGHHYKSNPVFAYSDSGGICPPGDRLSDGREEKAAHEKNIEEYFSHHEKKRTFYKPLFKQHKDTRLW